MNTTLLRNVLLCDGSGSDPVPGDVFFENGRIVRCGDKLPKIPGVAEYDGGGLVLAPGFIDIHAHSDLALAAAPEAFGKITQGVTTEVSGNCGLSPFPVLTGEVREHLQELYRKYDVPVTWTDLTGYASFVESRAPAVNFCTLCGHNTLRANILGYGENSGSPKAWRKIALLLGKMLEQGAAGLSTGLLYVPGKFASTEELEITASALKGTGKLHATHLRSEGDHLLEAVGEAMQISRAGSGRLQISHIKTAFPRNWHKIDPLLELIRNTHDLEIHADRYPYSRAMTSLSVILPPPYDVMTDAAIQQDLAANPEKQALLVQALLAKKVEWNKILLCSTADERAADFCGKNLAEAAQKLGLSPENLCVQLMVRDAPGTMAAFSGLSTDNMKTFLLQKFVCCGSDETARPLDGSLGFGHPRGFGSFPAFFRIVSEALGIGEAIRKMTALPAQILGLTGRGRIAPGYAADLVLFDPDTFAPGADFAHPHRPAQGLRAVWVNGVLTYENGKVCSRAGRFLKVS